MKSEKKPTLDQQEIKFIEILLSRLNNNLEFDAETEMYADNGSMIMSCSQETKQYFEQLIDKLKKLA